VCAAVGPTFAVEIVDCISQIGSGALPLETLASAGLAIRTTGRKGKGRALAQLSSALRALPVPVIGRVENDALILDLRCLEQTEDFKANIGQLSLAESADAAS
jgi:L-seryl-tRNA(Ser) seleniumtransferase